MTIVNIMSTLLALGVIVGQIGIGASLVYFLFFRKKQNAFSRFLTKHGLMLAFVVALVCTCGSLFYSEIAGFTPCELCWFQRIFMYPEVILLGLAVWRKNTSIVDYVLSLSVVGGLISLYHNYIYYYNNGLNAHCLVAGQGVSCVKRYVFEFGYITIPMMALTGFAIIIVCLVFVKMGSKRT